MMHVKQRCSGKAKRSASAMMVLCSEPSFLSRIAFGDACRISVFPTETFFF